MLVENYGITNHEFYDHYDSRETTIDSTISAIVYFILGLLCCCCLNEARKSRTRTTSRRIKPQQRSYFMEPTGRIPVVRTTGREIPSGRPNVRVTNVGNVIPTREEHFTSGQRTAINASATSGPVSGQRVTNVLEARNSFSQERDNIPSMGRASGPVSGQRVTNVLEAKTSISERQPIDRLSGHHPKVHPDFLKGNTRAATGK